MSKRIQDEYYLLTEVLERITWALEGSCDDIDCDKYMYKNLLKKSVKPVLEHGFSCTEKINRDKAAVIRLLGQKKFRKHRYEKCSICKRNVDKLSSKSTIVSYTRPCRDKKGYYQMDSVRVHNSCSPRVKIPEGWKDL